MQVPINNLAPPKANLGTGRDIDKKGELESDVDFSSVIAGKSMPSEREGLTAKSKVNPTRDQTPKSMVSKSKRQSANTNQNSIGERKPAENRDSESSVENLTLKKTHKNKDQRNSAVQKLMASFENEFGISAERFSAALAQLPPEVKSMSIEKSAPFVIQQLGIPEAEQVAATQAYVNLLSESGLIKGQNNQTSEDALSITQYNNQGITNKKILGHTGEKLEENSSVSTKLSKRQKLNATIDELNKKFFDIQQKQALESAESKKMDLSNLGELQQLNGSSDKSKNYSLNNKTQAIMNKDLNNGSQLPLSAIGLPSVGDMDDVRPMNTLSNINYDEANNLNNNADVLLFNSDYDRIQNNYQNQEMFNSEVNSNQFSPNPILNEMNYQKANELNQDTGMSIDSLKELEKYFNPESSIEFSEINNNDYVDKSRSWSVEELPYITQQESGVFSSLSKEKNENMQNSGEHSLSHNSINKFDKNIDVKDRDSIDELLSEFNISSDQGAKSHSTNLINKSSTNVDPLISPQTRASNIERLSTATESLAGRGGGEVKVVLAPEGLGAIQLKVRVIEGKVHVEMKTENKDSQKVLEGSLSDLRHSLASHNLSVDSVKVDLGNSFSHRDESQAFSQPQQDFPRDQARQFMNQFREENAFQRQSLFEAPGFKSYRTQNEELLNPISQEIRPRSSLNINKGRDLNLVV